MSSKSDPTGHERIATSVPTDPNAFEPVADRLRRVALERPASPALGDGECLLDYRALDLLVDRVAVALQRDGVRPGQAVATCAGSGVLQAALCLGALRAGAVPAPIAPSVTPAQFGAMVADSGSGFAFIDVHAAALQVALPPSVRPMDFGGVGVGEPFETWLAPEGAQPRPVAISPSDPFNNSYSSCTTGTPKGIVQPHSMRFAH